MGRRRRLARPAVLANPGSLAFRLVTSGFIGTAAGGLTGAANTGPTTSISGQNLNGTFGQLSAR